MCTWAISHGCKTCWMELVMSQHLVFQNTLLFSCYRPFLIHTHIHPQTFNDFIYTACLSDPLSAHCSQLPGELFSWRSETEKFSLLSLQRSFFYVVAFLILCCSKLLEEISPHCLSAMLRMMLADPESKYSTTSPVSCSSRNWTGQRLCVEKKLHSEKLLIHKHL